MTIFQINASKANKLDVSIALRIIYYQPVGYQRNAKKLHEASLNAGYNFSIDEVNDCLERQIIHQIHKPQLKYILRASFLLLLLLMKSTFEI